MSPLHASCVEWDGAGLLICGRSGSGKSDLALRLIDAGAELVADDRVFLEKDGEKLKARTPDKIRGLIEVRGLGIVPMPFRPETHIKLKIALCPSHEIDRMPDPMSEVIEGIEIPLLFLDPSAASAVAKIKVALSVCTGERVIVQ